MENDHLIYNAPTSKFDNYFRINVIYDMNIDACRYRSELLLNNETDIEYKMALYKMKYLEKPEVYKVLSKDLLKKEKETITNLFKDILRSKSSNTNISKNFKVIKDELYD
jgi:hypothetical protein